MLFDFVMGHIVAVSLTVLVLLLYSKARLLHLFPIEGGTIAPEKRIIPFLPGN